MNPIDPLIIGLVAGVVSTYGFNVIQPILESYGVHDTCGVNNLHGMPSLVGGLASVFITAYKGPRGSDMPDVFNYPGQAGVQIGAMCITLIIAVSSGIFTGLIMRKYGCGTAAENFSDFPYWEVEAFEGEEHKPEGAHTATDGDVEMGQGSAVGGNKKYDSVPRSSDEANLEDDVEVQHVKL